MTYADYVGNWTKAKGIHDRVAPNPLATSAATGAQWWGDLPLHGGVLLPASGLSAQGGVCTTYGNSADTPWPISTTMLRCVPP
eukprot:6458926-Amphidinium_carterae.1